MEHAAASYQCPGETRAIDRATHLGRLAAFYSACRGCAHNSDTGPLPAVQYRRLALSNRRVLAKSPFDAEGLNGVWLNEIDGPLARRFASAVGICLWKTADASAASPRVLLAGDGRAMTAELVAAASEGLRYAGCAVSEVGGVTAPCLATAARRLEADGAVLIGNPAGRAETVGVSVWQAEAKPCSAAGHLDAMQKCFEAGADRPARGCGPLGRETIEADYLARLRPGFHALRPLRVIVDCSSAPLWKYLQELTGPSACEFLRPRDPSESAPAGKTGDGAAAPSFVERRLRRMSQQALADRADFGLWIDGDGQACRLVDERGREIAAERLLLALGRDLLREHPGAGVAIESETFDAVAAKIIAAGGRPQRSGATRESMFAAMQDAMLGGGASGRYWFAGEPPIADALRLLSLVLTLLSQTDRTLSTVLDAV